MSTPDDSTRKQRREAARDERKALEAAASTKAARQRRLIQLGGALGAAIVVVVVAIVISSSGGSKALTAKTGAQKTAAAAAVSSLLAGIPQSGTTLGSPTAPVTLDYYGDLECPICQDFTLQTLPTFIPAEVKTGKVKIVYRSLETATGNSSNNFLNQQVAAYAAGGQSKAWDYIELFYHEQGTEDTSYVTEKYLDNLAEQVPGLNLPSWQAARNDATYANTVKADEANAAKLGFSATPTLVAIGPKGTKGVSDLLTPSQLDDLISSVA
jgi:protein-disulfide isomerase